MPHRTGDSASELKDTARALAVLRARAGLSQAEVAERLAITPQAYQRYEAGDRQAVMRTDLQDRLTRAMGYSRDDLAAEVSRSRGELPQASATIHPFRQRTTPLQEASELPIRDRVQAGAWLAADDLDQGPPRSYPAARDPRFPGADQWLSEVQGDSVDLLRIYDGDLAHFVDAIAIGYAPRTGDVVEVERLRYGGSLRELTLKQIEVVADGVLLWPRSTNTKWQLPLELTEGAAEGEDMQVRIRGLLLNTIRRF